MEEGDGIVFGLRMPRWAKALYLATLLGLAAASADVLRHTLVILGAPILHGRYPELALLAPCLPSACCLHRYRGSPRESGAEPPSPRLRGSNPAAVHITRPSRVFAPQARFSVPLCVLCVSVVKPLCGLTPLLLSAHPPMRLSAYLASYGWTCTKFTASSCPAGPPGAPGVAQSESVRVAVGARARKTR